MNLRLIGRKLGPDVKILSGPVLTIIIVILLSVVVFKNGYSKVMVKSAQYNESKQIEASLSEKLNTLKEVSTIVLESGDASLIALPSDNPATLAISNLKTSASEKTITIKEFKVMGQGKGEVSSMGIQVSTENPEFPSFVAYLKDLVNSAPVMVINKLESEKSVNENMITGELEVSIYWADLPTTLPELKLPIEELNSEQQLVLVKMGSLKRPIFTTLEPQASKERSQPFY